MEWARIERVLEKDYTIHGFSDWRLRQRVLRVPITRQHSDGVEGKKVFG